MDTNNCKCVTFGELKKGDHFTTLVDGELYLKHLDDSAIKFVPVENVRFKAKNCVFVEEEEFYTELTDK